MPDHSPSTDERASLTQPSQSSSPLECTSHLGFSLGTCLRKTLGNLLIGGPEKSEWKLIIDPVASPRNVTEILAAESCSNQN